MTRTLNASPDEASVRETLRRRVKQMCDWFNQESWEKCYSLIDPKLREGSRVQPRVYAERMKAFKDVYGAIRPWHIQINLHLDASSSKQDERSFAYVYVVWQDAEHGFHLFKERWVKDSDRWYTRVVGLVPTPREPPSD